MSFLYRPRSIHVHTKQTSLPPAVENVLQKDIRPRTSSMAARRIMRRVSSIFLSKKKRLPDVKLANSVADHHTTVYAASCASSTDSTESEDDIRRPSGLGQAVVVMSNRSLPPSPFTPPSESSLCQIQDYQRIRALSSPNLLQSFNKARVKPKSRPASISLNNDSVIESIPSPLPPLPPLPISSRLPEEVTVHILSYLSRGTIASCSQVSKSFAEAARYNLYSTLNFDSMSLLQLEQLLALLASRRDLTELVSTFICHKWPSFFISDRHCRSGPPTGYVFQHKDVLLTATFTLALEGMTNITSLTLPAFDASLLAHHSAFGLKRLTFTNHTISESDTRALFSWLDGQTNIVSLRFMNLEDVITPVKDTVTVPYRNTICGTPPSASPFTVPSPRSFNFQQPPTLASPFSSPSLLPSLVELYATPSILTSLALLPPSPPSFPSSPPSPSFPSFPSSPLPFPPSPPVLRPLTTVSLNITTTLYTGLRPATLMNQLRGISHLCLKFGRAVDRRTFEKVVGAAGGVLGGREGEGGTQAGRWVGLSSLEVGFHDSSSKHSRRDEVRFVVSSICVSIFYQLSLLQALYKALQISLPRYKSLRSLRLLVAHEPFVHTPDSVNYHVNRHTDNEQDSDDKIPSKVEQILIDSWLKLCPSLEVVTLFSGSQWRKELDDRQEL